MGRKNRGKLIFIVIIFVIGVAGLIYFAKTLDAGINALKSADSVNSTEKNLVNEAFKIEDGKEIELEIELEPELILNEKMIDVPYISQENKYPTGCESVSAVMLLRYFKYDISVDTFIDKYLEKQDYYWENGVFYAPHPNDAFIGDPRTNNSYGCYAPVIVKALNKYLAGSMTVVELTGTSIENIIETYINKDIPVLLWASMNMKETKRGSVWNISPNETFEWIAGEHCMVLVGYDEYNYYFNDPFEGNGIIGFEKGLVEKRYKELGCQAIVAIK